MVMEGYKGEDEVGRMPRPRMTEEADTDPEPTLTHLNDHELELIGQIQDGLDRLEERLRPVLRSSPAMVEKKGGPSDKELPEALGRAQHRIQRLNDTLVVVNAMNRLVAI